MDGNIQLDMTHVKLALDDLVDSVKVKPRRDDRGGRTRIPHPVGVNSPAYKMFDTQPLKRYDSGVDINHISPTDASIQAEDRWQHNQYNTAALSFDYNDPNQEFF